MWSCLVPPRDHAADFCQFVHQALLVLQPSGRVRQQHVDAARPRRLPRVENHRGGICSALLRDDRHLVALPPGLQLFDRGGAERIAGGQHDRQSLVLESLRQLADRRGLAGTVDADHQDHEGPVLRIDVERLLDGRQDIDERAAQATTQRVEVLQLLACQALLQVLDDARRRVDADVGHDEHRFEIFERVLVDLATRGQVREVVGQPAVAPVDSGPQALDESLAFGGFVLFP